MDGKSAYQMATLIHAIFREAANQPFEAKLAVGNVIRNRVNSSKIKQWGLGWDGVILHPWQFSSFNKPYKNEHGNYTDSNGVKVEIDPGLLKFPAIGDPGLDDCIKAAEMVFNGNAIDNTGGATSYFDKSRDKLAPTWATDGSMVRTADIGSFHFYRGA